MPSETERAWCDGWIEGAIAVGFLMSPDNPGAGEEWYARLDEYIARRPPARSEGEG